MKQLSRRRFLSQTAFAGVAATAFSATSFASSAAVTEDTSATYAHHVFYWMKNEGNEEDKAKLLAGLKKLCTIQQIKFSHIGKPNEFKADVVEKSYAFSLLMIFDSLEAFDLYHKDPKHQEFVSTCKDLWGKKMGFGAVPA